MVQIKNKRLKDVLINVLAIMIVVLLIAVVALFIYASIKADVSVLQSDIPWWMKWKLLVSSHGR